MEHARTLMVQDGTTIAYRLWRPGRPRRLVILLHGMASNMTRWTEFVEHASLKESWDILRLDLRGHGGSTHRGPIGMESWCLDIATLLKVEGYDKAVIIGHSLGAQIAPHLASRYPTLVSGLVLIDPVFHEALRGSLRWASRLKPLLWVMVGVVRLLCALGLCRRRIPARDLRELDEETRKVLLSAGKKEEMVRHYSSAWEDFKFFPVEHYLRESIEMIRPLPDLARLHIPVLVLLSSGVTYTDPGVTKEIVSRSASASTVTIDAYHWPLTEKPEEVRHAIEVWCARHFNG